VADFFQQIYNGLLRFTPLKNFKFKSNRKGNFPSVGFLSEDRKKDLEKTLGITITNKEYFEQALTHRSYLQCMPEGNNCLSNERLEFLGDSVLGMIIAEHLFMLHSNSLEGKLSKMRSWLVNKRSLALCAQTLGLDEFLMMSHSAEKSLKQGSESILEDTLEAIIAAIYLDSGMENARDFIVNSMLPIMMSNSVMVDKNYKSILLERVQAEGKHSPEYAVLEESGPDHDKEFIVAVYVDNKMIGKGCGKSKKQAEQAASKNAIDHYFEFQKSG
jgi:ribonuclease III